MVLALVAASLPVEDMVRAEEKAHARVRESAKPERPAWPLVKEKGNARATVPARAPGFAMDRHWRLAHHAKALLSVTTACNAQAGPANAMGRGFAQRKANEESAGGTVTV